MDGRWRDGRRLGERRDRMEGGGEREVGWRGGGEGGRVGE